MKLTICYQLQSDKRLPSAIIQFFFDSRKVWDINDYETKMLPDNIPEIMCNCLNSKDDQVVKLTVETLNFFSTVNSSRNGSVSAKKESSYQALNIKSKNFFKVS